MSSEDGPNPLSSHWCPRAWERHVLSWASGSFPRGHQGATLGSCLLWGGAHWFVPGCGPGGDGGPTGPIAGPSGASVPGAVGGVGGQRCSVGTSLKDKAVTQGGRRSQTPALALTLARPRGLGPATSCMYLEISLFLETVPKL